MFDILQIGLKFCTIFAYTNREIWYTYNAFLVKIASKYNCHLKICMTHAALIYGVGIVIMKCIQFSQEFMEKLEDLEAVLAQKHLEVRT